MDVVRENRIDDCWVNVNRNFIKFVTWIHAVLFFCEKGERKGQSVKVKTKGSR